ncbi:MAG: MerR family transcriptional regulator [Chloroflexota bacterium]
MFRIGEFSKIAQIPDSQLRYYDRIGLFQPAHIDKFTSYRYYSADQLPDLNRILALREMGLTLEQIKRMVLDNISAEEMRGMLALRKAQVEQTLQDELHRLRIIEARLRQVEQDGVPTNDDVVIKSVPAQPFFSTRNVLPNLFDGATVMGELMQLGPRHVGRDRIGYLTAVIHGDAFRVEQADVEMGFLLKDSVDRPLLLPSGLEVKMRILPAAETVVSAVRIGPFENGYDSYAKLGRWVESNGFTFAGPAREVFIESPMPGNQETAVCEIQFPVTSARPHLSASI